MDQLFETLPFRPADILLPKNCDMTRWSVLACDQYTSQPEYWQRVSDYVGHAPSTLRLILPESHLEDPGVDGAIREINHTMTAYLRSGQFQTLPDTLIYVERTLSNGKIRRGVVGMVDLEQYDYEPGSPVMIRATEGVVLERIPPRVAVRKNAPIELPHIMLLCDDRRGDVILALKDRKESMEKVYDFELMENGGRIAGWRMDAASQAGFARALAHLADPAVFVEKYGVMPEPGMMMFAVGDGNHSLATAKECYERQKKITPPERWAELPSRFALAELCDLYDESLQFEAIHRVVFGVEPQTLLDDLAAAFPGGRADGDESHALHWITARGEGTIPLPPTAVHLAVAALQGFLDDWRKTHRDMKVDYIHGETVVRDLARRENTVGFLLPAMDKEQLFPTVIYDTVLPRKTFSMGHADDKRFYLEARKIR